MGYTMSSVLKSLFFWMVYIIFRSTQFIFRWANYNLFPEKHECGNYLKYVSGKYFWEMNKDFKPITEEDKYPYDFLVCEHCKVFATVEGEDDG